MLKRNDIIKHVNFADVALQLMKPPIITASGALKLRNPLWINQGYVKSYIIDRARNLCGPTNIRIERADFKDWLICKNPQAECVRYENWSILK